MIIEIGILNANTGEYVWQEFVDPKKTDVLNRMKRVAGWFNEQDTFYSGKHIWSVWENVGITQRFLSVVFGESLRDVASTSVMVFSDDSPVGTEYEFYVQRKEASNEI